MTQEDRNRQVHEEVIREFRALTMEERVERLIASGILTADRKLAPEYVTSPGVAPEAAGDDPQPR